METESQIGEIQVERVDDIPVIYGHLQKMHIQTTIDQVLEPHGNWQGLSPGWIITIWLIHILSAHTHCMDRVQDWVTARLHTLHALTGQALTALDFTDDRLALCLRMLSQTPMRAAMATSVGGSAEPRPQTALWRSLPTRSLKSWAIS